MHQLSAQQADDQAGGGRNADPAAVDAGRRQVAVRRLREANDLGRLAEVREPRENLVALGFERALVEMRIGFRARGGPISLERGVCRSAR